MFQFRISTLTMHMCLLVSAESSCAVLWCEDFPEAPVVYISCVCRVVNSSALACVGFEGLHVI